MIKKILIRCFEKRNRKMNIVKSDQNRKVIICPNKGEMISYFLRSYQKSVHNALHHKDQCNIALSGGNTPKPYYKELLQSSLELPWHKIHLFLVDERFVPHTHKDSNYNMIKTTLLNHIPIPKNHIHFIPIEKSVLISMNRYENELIRHFHLKPSQFPLFDLTILGLGTDGHTASLFPQSPAINEKERLVTTASQKGIPYKRISLTLPVINNSKKIIFLIEGYDKAKCLREIIINNANLPASFILPNHGSVLFLLDLAAASSLEGLNHNQI